MRAALLSRPWARGVLHRAARIVAVGAMFSAVSEFWAYPIELGMGQIGLIVAYGLFGYVFLLTLRYFQVCSFAGLFVAAGVFGFLVEGTVVPVLYLNLPFSIAWTSLAWHALFTIGVGYFLYRRVMSAPSARNAVLLNAAIGLAFGIWNAYFWTVVEGTDPVAFSWQPTSAFAAQFLMGWAFFLLGHVLLDMFPPPPRPPGRLEFGLFLSLAILPYLLTYLWVMFPLSLALPALLLVSFAALRAGRSRPESSWLETFFSYRIALRRYGVSLLIPVMAIATYQAMAWARLEWETNVVIAVLVVPLASVYWVYALFRANHPGHLERRDSGTHGERDRDRDREPAS